MKKILLPALAVVLVLPGLLIAQPEEVSGAGDGDQEWVLPVFGAEPIDPKPQAFYYRLDFYQPVDAMLTANQFVLDENLITQVERAVGRSTFMADPYLLRRPVGLEDNTSFVNIDKNEILLDVSAYQERGVKEWEVQILDAGGDVFRSITGRGSLPSNVYWDGRDNDGYQVMVVDDNYSYLIVLTFRDGSQIRKIGRPISLKGLVYENVVAIKQGELTSPGTGRVSSSVERYYQYVLNRFKALRYSGIHIRASNKYLVESIQEYLMNRLHDVDVTFEEVPEYSRVEFIFQ